MVNKAVIPFLVTMMLVTGVCNTILNKYQVGFTFASIGGLNGGRGVEWLTRGWYPGYAMCEEL